MSRPRKLINLKHLNSVEITKIAMGHDDPAMNEQIDLLTDGNLNEWSIDYFQQLSRLGFYIYLYFREEGSDRIQSIVIEDGCVDGVDDAGQAARH